MKRRLICYILIVAMLITSFSGCGASGDNQDANKSEEIVLTGELAPVASFYDINLPFYDLNIDFVWQGDDFVYMEKEWDRELRKNICTISRVPADGSGEAVQIYQSTAEEPSIWNFTMDDEGNFYTLSWVPLESEELVKQFTMRKYDADMKEIMCVEPDSEQVSTTELNATHDMYIDDAGHIVLADYENHAYFFDEELNFLWKEKLLNNFYDMNFVDAGEQGTFFAAYDDTTSRVSLLKIDYEKQCLTALPEINMSDYVGFNEYLQIIGGGEYGVLLSTNNTLFKCNLETGEVEPWFDWKDSNMNVYGETLKQVRFHEKEDEIFMSAWCYDWRTSTSEMAEISYIDKAYLPEKQTVVLGTWVYSDVEKFVDQFNRNNRQYIVEIKEYESSEELVQAFLFGQDEVPDILDISIASSTMLQNKGILEDLQPYFEESEVVNKDDILDSIWDMCMEDGKLTSMITQFGFRTCVTALDTIPEDGWTIEEFFALEDTYPESKPLLYYRYSNVMHMLGDMSYENFIDWDKKKSDFDSKEFIELIKKVKSMDLDTGEITVYYQEEEEINALLAKDFLIDFGSYNTPYSYRRKFNKYRGCVKNIGFPTSDGEPYYYVYPDMQLAIYSGSEKKDGAWAFIEYLLSEDAQTWYGEETWAFPVRQEVYEEFLSKPQSAVKNYVDDDTNIDSYSVFMNMIEHAHLLENGSMGMITSIINEELQAYFESDKTAEETAKIIQSRVQIYLDENY